MKKNFLGLEEQYCKESSSKIVILPVPFDKTTTYIKGSDEGPKAILEASENLELYDIQTDKELYKLGIHTTPEKIYPSSKKMLKHLYEDVLYYLEKDKLVVTIGGEHSISYAPIKAHLDFFKKPISILHFDAHSDFRPSYENNPDSHACVMYKTSKLPLVENIISIGIRSSDIDEQKYLNKKNIFYANDIHNSSSWMDKAISGLTDTVYISFDLDVFDSSVMPSTGTPEPGGLFWHQVDNFLFKLSKTKKIIGFDVVELCPIKNFIAPDFLAAKLIYKMLNYAFEN